MSKFPIWVWFIIPTVVIIVAGAVVLSRTPQKNPKDENKPAPVSASIEGVQEFEIASRQHIASGTAATDHNSNPPTSGQHWPTPAKNGVFEKTLPDEQVLHSLEHGYIWISYKVDAPEEIIQNLKNIVQEDDWKLILSPREKNDSQITIASWGRLLKMDEPDYDKVREFIRAFRNKGPEKTPN